VTELQRTDDWHAARLGKVTASRISDVMARTKTGYGASRETYMSELILERLTEQATEGFKSAAMQRGIDLEPMARQAYEEAKELWVVETGFIAHPRIANAGASPDGFVDSDGLVEIKCLLAPAHLETLLSDAVPDKYFKQMQMQMATCNRAWCDYAAYNPDFPDHLRLFVKRIPRDDKFIAEMEGEIVKFLGELEAKLATLTTKFARAA
jgi:putative phage-type endonuclease